MTWITASNTWGVYTITIDTSTSATSTTTYTFTTGRARSQPVPPPPPKPKYRKHEVVRVLSDGILHGRIGHVGAYLPVEGMVVMVCWPQGGWTAVREDSLEPVEVEET